MSLLIDALKQAEASRKKIEPPSSGLGYPRTMELSPTDKEILAQEAAQLPSDNKPLPSSAEKKTYQAQQAVRELLEAKQKHSQRTGVLAAVAGALVLLTLGSYALWTTLQPRSSLMSHSQPQHPVSLPVENMAISPDAAPSDNPSLVSASSSSGRASPAVQDPVRLAVDEPLVSPPASPRPATVLVPTIDSPARVSVYRASDDAGSKNEPSTVAHIQKTPFSGVRHDSSTSVIARAYEAMRAGDLPRAHDLYRQVLVQDPQNIDALNALGVISLRTGRTDHAEKYFRGALTVSPKDATAVSQLLLLYSEGDMITAEARLLHLIAEQPNIAAAHFALGNLLSRQRRWSEAQQAFFQALTLDNNNPDVLYNLAVSLDQMRQSKLAQQYYEQAALASKERPASFDAAVAKNRADVIALSLASGR